MHYDVVIIGAGMSGLAAGIRVAHFGKKPLILEKHSVWGGLNSFYKKGGHHFDVGLHAVTNWLRPGYSGPRVPLQRIYRQLRLSPEDFALEPQTHSYVVFGDARLRFSNDLEELSEGVRQMFPASHAGFVRLCERCAEYPEASTDSARVSTRRMLTEFFDDPLLTDMLLCPLLYYGSAEEHDLDWEQFIILFNSIYREGFCRPRRGVRQVLDTLMERYESLGGEMIRKDGVERLVVSGGNVSEIVLQSGKSITADVVLSSAGRVETARLRSDGVDESSHAGQLAFTETLWMLDRDPRSLGFDGCVTFFGRSPFAWARPKTPVDLTSGVICVPGNYAHKEPLDRHLIRVTHLADHGHWHGLDQDRYAKEKAAFIERSLDVVAAIGGDLRPHITYTDSFTPRTVTKYTSHVNGAVYGSPDKVKTGRTDLSNLFLCGTDQGFVGIVGAMLSGINMANAHALAGGGHGASEARSEPKASVGGWAGFAGPGPAKPGILSPKAATAPSEMLKRRPKLLTAERLKDLRPEYDLIVIGSGLAGLTAANRLGRDGHSVLLLEQHYNFGGLATWFKRQHGHIFDISLHGFPVGMIKTCRKYWTREIADSIVQLKSIRFDNPQFSLETTFDREDFTRILVEKFGVERATVEQFFDFARGMNFYDDQALTTRQLFERFFPGRTDVWRLLMEPIAYANGSTLDDPAITYGIVFSNFMSKGVYTFQGGTDQLIKSMKAELSKNGVDVRNYAQVERILVEGRPGSARATGVLVNGQVVKGRAVLSNANVKSTVVSLVGEEHFGPEYVAAAKGVRMNSSSTQVYLGIKKGETLPFIGELFFTSSAKTFDSEALTALDCTSRTFSFYYPDVRPGSDRYAVVASINSNYRDWAELSEDDYLLTKERYASDAIDVLERYLPDVRPKIEHVEVATPRTFKFFTQAEAGTSFGTKFEGLKVSQDLPKHVAGLFHAGSVGIIMSGWLGAANYGVIVANEVDRYLRTEKDKTTCQTLPANG